MEVNKRSNCVLLLDDDVDDVDSDHENHQVAGAHWECHPVKVVLPDVGAHGHVW